MVEKVGVIYISSNAKGWFGIVTDQEWHLFDAGLRDLFVGGSLSAPTEKCFYGVLLFVAYFNNCIAKLLNSAMNIM